MGAQLAKLSYAVGARARLRPTEMRLLTYMCLRALDTDAPPKYFAAREESAAALGRLVEDYPDPSDPAYEAESAARLAAFQAVKTAVSGLVKARAIRRISAGREGSRAVFEITLEAALEHARQTPEG